MDIEEYRKQFIDELRFNAEHEGTEPETQFIEKYLSDLEEIGELNDPIPMSVEMRGSRNRLLAFDAYAYDEADGVAKTEHSHPLGMVVSTHFRCGKGVKRGLKNGALPFNID